MARCPLCSRHPAKRYCPAKETQICSSCCGAKREVEIDCPSSCHYLRAGRAYEGGQRIPDPQLANAVQKFDREFLQRHSEILTAISIAVIEERAASPWLMDSDVIEVFAKLATTMKTLSSGIYYETLPEGTVQLSLFRRLRQLLDELMQPQAHGLQNALKLSDTLEILNFFSFAATVNSNTRPRSRQYLDLLSDYAEQHQPEGTAGNLVIP